jgi:hypothetical protein
MKMIDEGCRVSEREKYVQDQLHVRIADGPYMATQAVRHTGNREPARRYYDHLCLTRGDVSTRGSMYELLESEQSMHRNDGDVVVVAADGRS